MVEEEFQNDVWISCLKHLLGALYERRRLFISDLRQKSLGYGNVETGGKTSHPSFLRAFRNLKLEYK